MDFYVYILKSLSTGIFYKGFSSNPNLRLSQHNNGRSRFTANKGPWKMVYLEKMVSKREALIRERQLKRANMDYIKWLIDQDFNLLKHQNDPSSRDNSFLN
jgi:putative endonuclease